MPSTQYGNFANFCKDTGNLWSTLPGSYSLSHRDCASLTLSSMQCMSQTPSTRNRSRRHNANSKQLFVESHARGGSGWGGCNLTGITYGNNKHLANLGAFQPIATRQGCTDDDRLHHTLRHRHYCCRLLALEIRAQTRRCRTKVRSSSTTVNNGVVTNTTKGNAAVPDRLHHCLDMRNFYRRRFRTGRCCTKGMCAQTILTARVFDCH